MNHASHALLPLLKQYFGYTSFRPLQEEIIRDSLAGRDTFALLPTGGGKSLCFQLPALVRPGLTVVISPLIALMKDQVDAMQASGVSATFLNSSLAAGESRPRLRGLDNGEYKLLYVAPERLLLPDFLDGLKRWNVSLFAIDEAHCISEWGHDFRPEYRQISTLREVFPGVPFMALTATATERVRADIVKQLLLREPHQYVASFNRPNLIYRVSPKANDVKAQVLRFVRARPKESGIVYCQRRKDTESLAARLQEDGVCALPYHAGLDAAVRARNQEMFLRDEVRVICATIAFGMGINKPNVRYVVHAGLPKNVEGYYQETGRAGRDGLPGECLLFFSEKDFDQQYFFIKKKPDPQELQVALDQLYQMVDYAESADCRRAELLRYFDEELPHDNCGGCDNCLSTRETFEGTRETFDGTIAAQKLLSCVYRIRQKSGFGVGASHLAEVLTGAYTVKIRRWGHESLSTYGIGKKRSRAEWVAFAHELVRLGYLRKGAEKFATLEVTPEGRAALAARRSIQLTRPESAQTAQKRAQESAQTAQKRALNAQDRAQERSQERALTARPRVGEIECDEALFEKLRRLCKELADDRGVPSYVIFGDVSMRHMARDYPTSTAEFAAIHGVDKYKLNEFGGVFIEIIKEFLLVNPHRSFI